MDDDLKELKSLLRSLVVSSPTQMDVRTLMRDFRNMVGSPMPLAKYGHRDPVAFLKEHFDDCFVMTGPSSNPVLTLIVPDTLKHIDQFVQRQKVPSTAKFKSKRRSIPESAVNKQNLIFETFVKDTLPVLKESEQSEVKAPDIVADASHNTENAVNHQVTSTDVKNFLKKRLPLYNSLHNLEEPSSEREVTISLCQDDDSGKHTSSSSSSTKALQLEELKSDIMELIRAAPRGVWCTDLIRLYRERFNREINFIRFGYTSVISLVYTLGAGVVITRPDATGDWHLAPRGAGPPPPAPPAPRRRVARASPPPDPDDALPGIDYDADVFPADCLHFTESIPAQELSDVLPGAMVEVMVGEVYSPSHFWLIRLGDQYHIAMENMMDEMTEYYNGSGRSRTLARGAVRVGHYCSALFLRDWHRALIVRVLDSDTVKVRYVDYGTVGAVAWRALRPLRREWARLPAQALRARLAGLRPCAAGRRWPPSAAAAFLRLVRDTPLVANIVAVDTEEAIIETLLIETSTAVDRNLSTELIRAGHADERPDSALWVSGPSDSVSDVSASASELVGQPPRRLRTWAAAAPPPGPSPLLRRLRSLRARLQQPSPAPPATPDPQTAECYLNPRFEALESGATPNLEEIHAYLRDGIVLDYVAAYREHVPACLPPEPAPAPSDSPASDHPPDLPARIPLWLPTTPDACLPSPSSPTELSSPQVTSQRPLSPPAAPLALSPKVSEPCEAKAHSAINVQLDIHKQPNVNIPPDDNPQTECRRQSVVHPQPAAPCPPPGVVAPAWPGPYPPPGVVAPAWSSPYAPPGVVAPAWPGPYAPPAWPGPYAPPGAVALSPAECDTYRRLVHVNPEAAHWYMAGALGRAMGPAMGPALGGPPHFPSPPPFGSVRAPPGFNI